MSVLETKLTSVSEFKESLDFYKEVISGISSDWDSLSKLIEEEAVILLTTWFEGSPKVVSLVYLFFDPVAATWNAWLGYIIPIHDVPVEALSGISVTAFSLVKNIRGIKRLCVTLPTGGQAVISEVFDNVQYASLAVLNIQ